MEKPMFAQRLRELREAKQWSQQRLAKESGVAQKSISNWEQGISSPRGPALIRLAKAFSVSVEELLAPSETGSAATPAKKKPGRPPKEKPHKLAALPPLKLPYRGRVAAGKPLPVGEEDHPPIDLSRVFNRDDLACWTVIGDSMIDDGIKSGDLAVVVDNPQPEPGNKVLVVVDGGLTLKRWRKRGKKCVLVPANAKLSPVEIDPVERPVRVLGTLYAVLRVERPPF